MEYAVYVNLPEGLKKARDVLTREAGLHIGDDADVTAAAVENGRLCGCASLCANTVKYVAVAPDMRGMNLTPALVSALRREAFSRGVARLFLYTKPENLVMFEGMNFCEIAGTADAVLLEDRRGGVKRFIDGIPRHSGNGMPIGGIVMNANPFTMGHRYLIETAAKQCGWVYVFVTEDDRSEFSAEDRLEMVREGCAGMRNVSVVTTGGYLVSSASFPDYFLKKTTDASDVQCELDCRIFGKWFAPGLGITKRFVGTEPFSALTDKYNGTMKRILPEYGVEVREIPRVSMGGREVSASEVRRLISEGKYAEAEALLPETSGKYIGRMRLSASLT